MLNFKPQTGLCRGGQFKWYLVGNPKDKFSREYLDLSRVTGSFRPGPTQTEL